MGLGEDSLMSVSVKSFESLTKDAKEDVKE